MSLTRELVDILTDGTRPDPKKEVKQFLKKCVRVQADVATIINTPIRKLNNRTPVHLAVIHGLWECLDILLKNGGIKYALNVCFKFIKFVAHTVTLELTVPQSGH